MLKASRQSIAFTVLRAEFNDNPGVARVRETLIAQRAALSAAEITAILEAGNVAGFGFEAYAPNGTQGPVHRERAG